MTQLHDYVLHSWDTRRINSLIHGPEGISAWNQQDSINPSLQTCPKAQNELKKTGI